MFGFGQKQIEIVLDKLNFSQGDVIKGRVVLKLKNPTNAKALKVGLSGEKTVTQTSFSNGRRTTTSYIAPVFSFDVPLDGEKDYSQGDYSFEIKIPADLIKPKSEGMGETVMDTLKAISGENESVVRWYVKANLDIPMRLDVKAKVQINIG